MLHGNGRPQGPQHKLTLFLPLIAAARARFCGNRYASFHSTNQGPDDRGECLHSPGRRLLLPHSLELQPLLTYQLDQSKLTFLLQGSTRYSHFICSLVFPASFRPFLLRHPSSLPVARTIIIISSLTLPSPIKAWALGSPTILQPSQIPRPSPCHIQEVTGTARPPRAVSLPVARTSLHRS